MDDGTIHRAYHIHRVAVLLRVQLDQPMAARNADDDFRDSLGERYGLCIIPGQNSFQMLQTTFHARQRSARSYTLAVLRAHRAAGGLG